MTQKAVVSGTRAVGLLVATILLYVGDAAAGWPVDWWVPVWGIFTLDAIVVPLAAAWGLGSGQGQLAASEQYGNRNGGK